MTLNADWDREAANWLAWARTPGHDVYWHYRDAFFALVPTAGEATLEVGCGEGRVSMPAAVAEAARVLTPDGRLCICVTHPFTDGGRRENYLTSRAVADPVSRGGLMLRARR